VRTSNLAFKSLSFKRASFASFTCNITVLLCNNNKVAHVRLEVLRERQCCSGMWRRVDS
jgi:hypothetical protein